MGILKKRWRMRAFHPIQLISCYVVEICSFSEAETEKRVHFISTRFQLVNMLKRGTLRKKLTATPRGKEGDTEAKNAMIHFGKLFGVMQIIGVWG